MRWTSGVVVLVLTLAGSVGAVAAEGSTEALARFDDSIYVVGEGPILFPVEYGEPLKVRFRVGELTIRADDINQVRAELEIDCRELSRTICENYSERLRLKVRRTDDGLDIYTTGLSFRKMGKLGVEGVLTVPRWSPLVANIGIGEVEIEGGSEDLEVQMGIGDLTVRVPEVSVGSVSMLTKIGDASLHGAVDRAGSRRRLLGARVAWSEGTGDAQIQVGLKIGDAKVVLE